MKLSQYAKRLGIKYKTAWQHFDKGLIPGAYQLPTKTIIVPDDVFDKLIASNHTEVCPCCNRPLYGMEDS